LEKLIRRPREEVRFGAGDGRDQVVDNHRLAVEGALLVGVGGQLDWLDCAGFLRNDSPQAAIVACGGQRQQGFKGAGVEVREKNSVGVLGKPRRAWRPR
jgi:hypothetical protein